MVITMSNATDLAREIKAGKKQNTLRCETGTVVRTAPLTVSLLGGELMPSAPLLILTAAAAERSYQIGDEVICLLAKSSVVLLDRAVRV